MGHKQGHQSREEAVQPGCEAGGWEWVYEGKVGRFRVDLKGGSNKIS